MYDLGQHIVAGGDEVFEGLSVTLVNGNDCWWCLKHALERADELVPLLGRAAERVEHGEVDTAAALGAMTWRFAERWLVRGYPECDFDTGVEQITRIFINALRLEDPRQPDLQTAEAG